MPVDESIFADLSERNFNPLNDVIFKFIFGSEKRKSITIDFLNTVLSESLGHTINDITYKSTENTAQNYRDKSTRFDVACRLDSGELVNVEVQVINQHNMARRTMYYWAQMYLSSIDKGDDYRKLKPGITVNLLAFNYFDDEGDDPHNMYTILNSRSYHRLNKDLELHFLELPKFSAKA